MNPMFISYFNYLKHPNFAESRSTSLDDTCKTQKGAGGVKPAPFCVLPVKVIQIISALLRHSPDVYVEDT